MILYKVISYQVSLCTTEGFSGGGCPRGVMVKVMDCRVVVHEFVLQSHYYVPFRANTLGKVIKTLILPAMGEIVPPPFFEENSFGIK